MVICSAIPASRQRQHLPSLADLTQPTGHEPGRTEGTCSRRKAATLLRASCTASCLPWQTGRQARPWRASGCRKSTCTAPRSAAS
jgi:hypothetical protein